MNPTAFIKKLKRHCASDKKPIFNPYVDKCEIYDRHNAPAIRSRNLSAVLKAFSESEVDAIWVGRDLGHRGGRRTGLALTDEAHLDMAGQAWGVELKQATKGDIVAERTAVNIWDVLSEIDERVFLWGNVFPFHPFDAGNPFSNRSHTAKERQAGESFLEELVTILEPKRLIGIGNDAHKSLERLFADREVLKVRHPSYGGEKVFQRQIRSLYGLS